MTSMMTMMKHALFFLCLLCLSHEVEGGGPRGVTSSSSVVVPSSSLSTEATLKHRFLGKKAPSKRECTFKEKSYKVEFKCKAKTGGSSDDGSGSGSGDEGDGMEETGSDTEIEIEDQIKFKVEAKNDEPLYVKVEYKQEIEVEVDDVEMENETKTSFAVEFLRLVEYRKVADVAAQARNANGDSDEDMAYEWGEDEVVSQYMLSEWSDFTAVQEDNETATFSVSTADDIATFVFTIAKADVGNINANKLKIDFDLAGFNWTANDTNVALVTAVETKRKIKVEYDDDEENGPKKSKKTKDVLISFDDAIGDIGFTPFGSYTWAETALVLGDNATGTNTTNMTTTDTNTTDTNTTDTNTTDTNSTDMTNTTTDDGDGVADGISISVVATSPSDDIVTTPTEDPDTTITFLSFSFVGSAAQGASEIYWDPEAGIGYNGLGSGANMALPCVGWTSLVLVAHLAVAWLVL